MTNRLHLVGAWLLVALLSGIAWAGRPNVLFVLCDDLRWDCLSAAGHPNLKTPNIDKLAAEGVRFANAFCTTSLCSPSRASILSGLYAHTHGVTNNFTEFPADRFVGFHNRLHESGYTTAYIGKWHMGEDNDSRRPGFDYFATHKGQGKYFDTEFNLNDKEKKVVPGYYTHVVTQLAADWLKNGRDKSKSFCLMLGHKAPHSFYVPEEKYKETFKDVDIQYPKTAFQLDDKPAWIKDRLYTWHGIYGPLFEWRKKFPDDRPEAVKDFANMTRAYWGTIQSVDDSMGQLVALLKEQGELDNTLIVFMGDNGLLNGEHGMVDKRTMHEPSIRIPIIVRFPKDYLTPKEHVVQQMVLTHDVAPSILEACGAKPLEKIHGQSFIPLAKGDSSNWRRSFFYEYNYEKQFPYTPNVRGVRTERYKYIHYPHGDGSPDRHKAELYDLQNDPGETRNLIDQPEMAVAIQRLQAELGRLMQASGIEKDVMPIDEGIKKELPDQKIR